jgi:hypothetical protein
MSKIKELKTAQSNVVNLIDIIELFSPEKKSKYTDLLLKLMKNTKSLNEHSKEVIENLTNNFDFIKKEDFDGFSDIQILLIYKFLDSFFNVSDLNNFRKFCEYNERGLVELNDLSRYKSFEDVINQMNIADLKAESKELETQIIKLYEDDEYIILRPLTYFASKKYGANTKWCTTTEGGEYFNKYNKKGVLVYCVGKTNGNKVACFNSLSKNEPEFSWWDAKDTRIDSMQSKLPINIRVIIEEVCLDANAKTNHMMLSPDKRKKQEELAKNNYRDINMTPRRRNLESHIENAIQRESEYMEESMDVMSEMEYPTEVMEPMPIPEPNEPITESLLRNAVTHYEDRPQIN